MVKLRGEYKEQTLFSFQLKGFSNSKKVLFSYALHGKGREKGILDKLKAHEFGRAVLLIPKNNTVEFREFLDLWDVEYKLKEVLIK